MEHAAHIAEFEQAARAYIQKAIGIDIGTEEHDLAFLDHYVRTIQKQGTPDQAVLDLAASALGVLFGQMVLHKLPGRWDIPPASTDPSQWRVAIDPLPFSFYPVAMAYTALRGQELENVDDSLSFPRAWQERANAFLEQLPPVPVDYFYSFTGRFETLCYLTEVSALWLHEKKATKKASAVD